MLKTEYVHFGDGYTGFLACAARAAAPMPRVVVIQEALGLDEHIEDVTARIAKAGYVALAPDCFARKGLRPEALTRERIAAVVRVLNTIPLARVMDPAAREEAFAASENAVALRETAFAMFNAAADAATHVVPVIAAARFLREEHELTRGQKIASIGFCMGGALSARLAAADPLLAGAVMFYGMAPPDDLAVTIQCPVLAFYGENDPRINGSIAGFREALRVPFEHHVFGGATHAFFNDTRLTYDVAAARSAWARTLAFFAERLA
jgi:carboxymethylenebutenolidase